MLNIGPVSSVWLISNHPCLLHNGCLSGHTKTCSLFARSGFCFVYKMQTYKMPNKTWQKLYFAKILDKEHLVARLALKQLPWQVRTKHRAPSPICSTARLVLYWLVHWPLVACMPIASGKQRQKITVAESGITGLDHARVPQTETEILCFIDG